MRRIFTVLVGFMFLTANFNIAFGQDEAAPKKKKKKKKKSEHVEGAAEAGAADATSEKTVSSPAGSSYKAAYGMAGCGLGTFVIKEDGIMQILAATTNGTSGSQTFGITSGTSNCAPSQSVAAAEQEVFIRANLASLEREAAQGSGEYLNAYAQILNCDQSTFQNEVRENHAKLFESRDASVVAAGLRTHFNGKCERASL